MDFTHDGDSMGTGGGGNALLGLIAGSALNKDDDRGKTSTMMIVLAVVFFVIVFIIALVFLAMAFKDKGYDHKYNNGTDIAALITPLIAAKSMDCKNTDFDTLEIKQKLEHNEDRAEMRRLQEEQNRQTQTFMQLGFGLSGQINGHEKTDLENFAKIENQLGMMQMGMGQLLQKANNEDIIQGVINRLVGGPCFGKC